MNHKDTYFVTGAAGFVGACLVRRLVRNGEDVSIVLKPKSDPWRLKGVLDKVKIYKGDLADIHTLSRIVRQVKPSVIYHLATHGAYPFQDDAEKIIKTNILGTWNLLKACSSFPYKVFVNTGSSSEYGKKAKAMQETDTLEPNSYYAVAKSAQTLLCQYVARSQKRPICTFRLFSVYGYYEESSRLIPTLIKSCLAGRELNMVSPTTARDFIFVDDVVEAYLRLPRLRKLRGEIINIGTGKQSSLKEVVRHALQLTDASTEVKWGIMAPRIWDTDIWVADTKRSWQLLRWKAKTPLREGLQKTIEWFTDFFLSNMNSGSSGKYYSGRKEKVVLPSTIKESQGKG